MALKPALQLPLPEPTAERVRRAQDARVDELQQLPIVGAKVLEGLVMPDSVLVPVAHKLGKAPRFVRESCVRGASTTGRVEQVTSSKHDPRTYIVLRATGFGATVTVDLLVVP